MAGTDCANDKQETVLRDVALKITSQSTPLDGDVC